MILNQLRSYIEDNGSVTRAHLAKHFKMSEDGVEAMVSVWLKKGIISRTVDTNEHKNIMRVRYRVQARDSFAMNVLL